MEYAAPEQVEAGAAVHLALDQLQPVDLTCSLGKAMGSGSHLVLSAKMLRSSGHSTILLRHSTNTVKLLPSAVQFKWKGETGSVQTYQHTETGRNIHIDSKGQFYNQDGKPTSQDAALDRAMPAGRAHSQNEYENSFGLGR